MSQSNYPLRLQTSLLAEARKLAEQEGASVNQFINTAVAEKISALKTIQYLRDRAARGNVPEALAILDRAGAEPPRPGDEIDAELAEDAARYSPAARHGRKPSGAKRKQSGRSKKRR